jgi:hypothetical protein
VSMSSCSFAQQNDDDTAQHRRGASPPPQNDTVVREHTREHGHVHRTR